MSGIGGKGQVGGTGGRGQVGGIGGPGQPDSFDGLPWQRGASLIVNTYTLCL